MRILSALVGGVLGVILTYIGLVLTRPRTTVDDAMGLLAVGGLCGGGAALVARLLRER